VCDAARSSGIAPGGSSKTRRLNRRTQRFLHRLTKGASVLPHRGYYPRWGPPAGLRIRALPTCLVLMCTSAKTTCGGLRFRSLPPPQSGLAGCGRRGGCRGALAPHPARSGRPERTGGGRGNRGG
jgi:hypothetical protein